MVSPPRFAELLQVLGEYRVEVIVIGGVAAVLQGAPIATVFANGSNLAAVEHQLRRTSQEAFALLEEVG